MNNIEPLLNAVRSGPVEQSHKEFLSLVTGLTFVVLAQPISTHCTIANDVHDTVVGKEAMDETKAKAGQGDFRSIIFWTNEQAKIMLMEERFVFFISPWSTGKTICMREKAAMWAKENPISKLYFVVMREEEAELTSLLEIELKGFFHRKHQLENIKVLGLTATPENSLTALYQMMRGKLPGSLMVDELIINQNGNLRWFLPFSVEPGFYTSKISLLSPLIIGSKLTANYLVMFKVTSTTIYA